MGRLSTTRYGQSNRIESNLIESIVLGRFGSDETDLVRSELDKVVLSEGWGAAGDGSGAGRLNGAATRPGTGMRTVPYITRKGAL